MKNSFSHLVHCIVLEYSRQFVIFLFSGIATQFPEFSST